MQMPHLFPEGILMDIIKSSWPRTILKTFFAFFIASAMLMGHSTSAGMISVDLGKPSCPGGVSRGDPFCRIQDGSLAATNIEALLVPPATHGDLIDIKRATITVESM